MSTRIGNFKITTQGVIQHWWKLNYFTGGVLPPAPEAGPNFLHNPVIRNETMNNIDLSGEKRFLVVDSEAGSMTIDSDIPEAVRSGIEAFGANNGWYAMKDSTNYVQITGIVEEEIQYSGDDFTAGDPITFFNPFMYYAFGSEVAIDIGDFDWMDVGIEPKGMWRKRDGSFRMVVRGDNFGDFSLGIATGNEADLVNSVIEDYMYKAGEGIFDIPGVCETGGDLYPSGNPIQIGDNLFLNFFTMGTKDNSGIGWVKHDEDFNIIEVCDSWLMIPDYPMNFAQVEASCIIYDGVVHLYFIDKFSSDHTEVPWKLIEAKIPEISSMTVTESNFIMDVTDTETWCSNKLIGVTPFVYFDTVILLVVGNCQTAANNILSDINSVGLLKKNSSGSFDTDNRSPLIISKLIDAWWPDNADNHIGSGMSLWLDGEVLTIYLPIRSLTDGNYRTFDIKVPYINIPVYSQQYA